MAVCLPCLGDEALKPKVTHMTYFGYMPQRLGNLLLSISILLIYYSELRSLYVLRKAVS